MDRAAKADARTGTVGGVPGPDPNIALTGRHVRLEPLRLDHVDDLARAATADRATYGFSGVPRDDTMHAYVEALLADRDRGSVVPFVQRRQSDGTLVGCTRFMELRNWRGRPEPDEVEIGGTWLSATAQRSGINTEAKLLLLGHAFDTWGVWRVALCTDVRNARSRAAIERLGATFEGVLRKHRPAYGDTAGSGPRDSAIFSIIDDDWPAVRENLLGRLDHAEPKEG